MPGSKLDLEEIKALHDKAFLNSNIPRELAAEDLVFATVTQWTDDLLQDTQLSYRGQFDITRKAIRQIMSDLRENPVQVNFDPRDETRDDAADLLDGIYRAVDQVNTSIESYDNAALEAVICGVGAWELYADYDSDRAGESQQSIRREPLYEANNTVFWAPNARLADKSDADYVSILKAYSEDGYKDLVKELTGEEPTESRSNFTHPEHSYTFPWFGTDKKIYVATFYHRKSVKEKVLTLNDPYGGQLVVHAKDLTDVQDELIDAGYSIESERKITRKRITRYIVSGLEVLDVSIIAGEYIPVVPVYGERIIVEGVEYWEGIIRLSKDPQKLHNFALSYLADIVSRSPRQQPIFFPEQVQGLERMYELSGADNNYPYMLVNRKSSDGDDLPVGPVSVMPEQPIPQSLTAMIELTRRSVEDVANAGLPDNVSDIDLSGKAISALQNRFDQQSIIYQSNMKHAKRRDGEVFASMAAEIYDAPRTVTIARPDGTVSKSKVLDQVLDKESGELVYINDLSNAVFDVYSTAGPSYSNKREESLEKLGEILAQLTPDDPLRQSILLKMLEMMDGVNMEDVREYAHKQLVLNGFTEPQDEEEQQMLMQAQQQQDKPDPMMVAAQAEEKKAQADIMDAQNKQMANQIAQFRAETERMQLQLEAKKIGMGALENQEKGQLEQFKAVSDAQDKRTNTEIAAAKAGAEIRHKAADATAKLRASRQKGS